MLEASLLGQEKERAEIGKELHDNINQMLATVMLYHGMALAEKDNREELILKGSDIIRQAINEIRNLSKSLVGPDTRQIGLKDCISELLGTIQAGTKVRVKFKWSGKLESLTAKVKLMLFRIVQEQTNNILKYAEAKTITIHLSRDKEFLKLLISDDGIGFDTLNLRRGIGLRNIASRVDIYNGKLNIISSPGMGCSLTVTIPSPTAIQPNDFPDQG